MSHNYFERHEVVASDAQPRKRCPDCRREWVYATYEFGPAANCPACGSPEVQDIVVRGGYDSTTDFDAIAPLLMGIAPEQLETEAAARAQLVCQADVQSPPATLQIPTSDRRSFAPEFD